MATIQLRELAHARTGDKRNTSNISLIPYSRDDYDLIREKVTGEVVKAHFAAIAGEVIRYELPKIHALNFVIKDALCCGVTFSLACDTNGKCLSSSLLGICIET